MKRHRKSLKLTDEDLEIWWSKVHWGADPHVIGRLGIHSIDSDSLDADLMFQAQSHPLISGHFTQSGEHVILRSNLASFRMVEIL